jgi:hypothetical protein
MAAVDARRADMVRVLVEAGVMQSLFVCIMYMDHMGSQARYESCTMMCSM